MEKKQAEKIIRLSEKVIRLSQNTLLLNLRFMDSAIYRLEPKPANINLATDGRYIYYNPEYILLRYKKEQSQIVRDVLHMVLHCVFRHPFVNPAIDTCLWDLATDIAVEDIIQSLNVGSSITMNAQKQKPILDELRNNVKLLNAEHIYHYLEEKRLSSVQIDCWREFFSSDDHSVWYSYGASAALKTNHDNGSKGDEKDNGSQDEGTESPDEHGHDKKDNLENETSSDSRDVQGDSANQNNNEELNDSVCDEAGNQENSFPSEMNEKNSSESGLFDSINDAEKKDLEKEWESVSRNIEMDMETLSKQRGEQVGSMVQILKELNRERFDYSFFLRKFAVMGETMKVNDDEFDYVFYTYGLQLYKNMPIIEPLEYKEEKRIRDFVVAIDTSGSTSGDLVKKFIDKTYNILKSTGSFFKKTNIHIIQCDAEIQEHVKITNQNEFDSYIEEMTIKGLGGTDFRPVFSLVDQLIANQEFVHLKGLIYFTDGHGVFPLKKPSYDVAFVFLRSEYDNPEVPPWAIKIILEDEEILGMKNGAKLV